MWLKLHFSIATAAPARIVEDDVAPAPEDAVTRQELHRGGHVVAGVRHAHLVDRQWEELGGLVIDVQSAAVPSQTRPRSGNR
jgi:hypothetical protein